MLASLAGVYGTSNSDAGAVPLVDSTTPKEVLRLSINYTDTGRSFSFAPQLIFAHEDDHIAGTGAAFTLGAGTVSAAYSLGKDWSVNASGRLPAQASLRHMVRMRQPQRGHIQVRAPIQKRGNALACLPNISRPMPGKTRMQQRRMRR